MIKDIDKSKLVIKPHPRESTDYSFFFPDICVFTLKIPIQLLDMLGVRFKIAYTVSSSALVSFPYKIKKRYWAYSHPKLLRENENGSL
jgi:hypothetical protein